MIHTLAISDIVEDMNSAIGTCSTPKEWDLYVQNALEDPAKRQVAHSCPFTLRSFQKPRGYPGDAVILDYIYGIETDETICPTDQLGIDALNYTSNSKAARAVRFRRSLLALISDEVASRTVNPRILSIASGHLREIDLSRAAQQGKIAEWVAIDQDRKSLELVEEEYDHCGARILHGSVKDILTNSITLENFDFTYSAGLFDYLEDHVAVSLIQKMRLMTKVGGTLLIANFLKGITDQGYMESFMDWKLKFRSKEDMVELFKLAGIDEADVEIFTNPDLNIVFAKYENS